MNARLSPLLRALNGHPIVLGISFLLIGFGLKLLSQAGEVWFITFLAVLMATLMGPLVSFFSRFVFRGLAVLGVLALMLGMVMGGGLIVAPIVSQETTQIIRQIPSAVDRAQTWVQRARLRGTVSSLPVGAELVDRLKGQATSTVEKAVYQSLPAAVSIVHIGLGLFLILSLGAFLVYQPLQYREWLQKLIPQEHAATFHELWRRTASGIQHWLLGTLVSMTIMGLIAGVGLMLAGVENWPLLALLTFIGTFIPYVGGIAAAVPGLIIGLSKSPSQFFTVLFVYLVGHFIEGYVLQPLIMRRAVELKPAILLIWQLFMGTCFGVRGIIVATPLLVCVEVVLQYLYVERYLGKAHSS